jgi:hypothetical protein
MPDEICCSRIIQIDKNRVYVNWLSINKTYTRIVFLLKFLPLHLKSSKETLTGHLDCLCYYLKREVTILLYFLKLDVRW